MRKTQFKKHLTTLFFIGIGLMAQAGTFQTLATEFKNKLAPIMGWGCFLCFVGGIIFSFQGEEGQGKAKWSFGAAGIALILYFGLDGIISMLVSILGL